MERRTATVPLWAAIVVIVSMILSGAGMIYAATSSASQAQMSAIRERVDSNGMLDQRQEDRLMNIEKLLERVVANEENLTKIVDRVTR